MSSDEEMFQECESGFDLDATATNPTPTNWTQTQSSNIDGQNVFDKTINFSTITANSTASLVASTSAVNDLSQLNEKSDDMLYKTTEVGQTLIANHTFEPLNQTIEMAEQDSNDDVEAPKNVIEDVPQENTEQNLPINEIASTVDVDPQSPIQELHEESLPTNVTQDLNNVPTSTVESCKTIDSPGPNDGNVTSSIQIDSSPDSNFNHNEHEPSDEEAPPLNAVIHRSEKKLPERQSPVDEMGPPIDFASIVQSEKCELQNQTMPMDVTQDLNDVSMSAIEMNQTIDLPVSKETDVPAPVESSSANETFAKNDFNGIECQMNVTVDVRQENIEQHTSTDEMASPIEVNNKMGKNDLQNQTIPMNVTQDLNEPISAVELNQTIDLPHSNAQFVTSPNFQLNGTFAANDSSAALNVTHNVSSKDLLSSNRRSFDAIGKNSTPTNRVNLNETVTVDNRLPCTNTSFIIPPRASTEMQIKPAETSADPILTAKEDPFKLPAAPSNASNPFDSKLKTQTFDIGDDEFQSPGCKFSVFMICILRLLNFDFVVFF